MAFSLNRATVIGNLTRDPELRYTPNGQAVAGFAVATNRRWTTQDGETQEATEFHEIVAWGKLGETAAQILKKGKKAYVEGRLQTRSWETPDGAKRQRTEIIAENLIALSPRDEGGVAPISPEETAIPESKTTKAKPAKGAKKTAGEEAASPEGDGEEEIDLSDLPF